MDRQLLLPAADQPTSRLGTRALVALGALFLATVFVMAVAESGGWLSNLAASVFLVETLALVVLDWRGFTTLNGRIRWGRLGPSKRLGLVVLYVFLWAILAPVYVGIALADRRGGRRAALADRLRIAELEAELGVLPPTDGTCPKCARPLQFGASYCAYCGTPVRERPRVCPRCAATTLPDARWCPYCGAPLEPARAPAADR